MDYNNISEETKKALHIAFVSESDLDFNEENGFGAMYITYREGQAKFEPTREEAQYLNKEQTTFLLEWLNSHSR